MVWNKAAFCL